MKRFAFALAIVLPLSGCMVGEERPEGDADGDYLLDEHEQEGWDVELELRAPRCLSEDRVERTTRHVLSNVYERDSDFDGVDDAEEFALRSDPRSNDTDGDGLSDSRERDINLGETVKLGGNLKLTRVDSDGDCLGDANETRGIDVEGIGRRTTDPTVSDSDEDGLADGREVHATHTDPLDADTDDDGMKDLLDGDPLHNVGVRFTLERFHLKTGQGPLRFHYSFTGPQGRPVQATDAPWVAFQEGENRTLPADASPGLFDVQDDARLPFQFWVVRSDGIVVGIVPGGDGPIVTGTIDHRNQVWTAGPRSGDARGALAWMDGPEGSLGFRLEVVYL